MKNLFPKSLFKVTTLALLALSFNACDEEAPGKEDAPELITEVRLTFTPTGGGNPVVVSAVDPDGPGVLDLIAEDISLDAGTAYTLSIGFFNDLIEPTDDGYDISAEVLEEADEHMLFFSWDGGFSEPTGNGNIDNRNDPVNYADEDSAGLPLGLSTNWITTTGVSTGSTFRILLKHQPDLKTASSGATVGETDVDVEFTLNIVEAN
ncbi:hypothetical protein SanaruYs_14310 [Chryseotalea sanaruensis]|uniref:GTP cyclohydrolase n=1 Tax=Chryseotalea sanaruensis TaxID=2482724 RepID=A0A401U8H0_9BACT|nr:hypothetical protein [Chryseotalea sanaruensis]GCC51211.1 hypothetical protein SanaruYs_14310 [Chryseotalea sanaruensis]